MTMNQITKELCKREGLKKQVDIAQMKEILGHLADIFWEEESFHMSNGSPGYALLVLGKKRSKKKKKK